MKMIFWKELRENAKWSLLGMLTFSLALFYVVSQFAGNFQDSFESICSNEFLLVTSFGGPLFGGALGLLQILPELRKDQWAYLVHRPIPLTTIFWAKFWAGLFLYALALLVPLFVAFWKVSVPGLTGGPFIPAMMIPGIMDICNGFLFYLCGLIVAMRPAKWFGSRLFPFGMGIIAWVYLHSSLMDAIVIFLTSLVILLRAARGFFVSKGSFQGNSAAPKPALVIVVWAGSLTVIFGVFLFVMVMVPYRDHRQDPRPKYRIDFQDRVLRVDQRLGDNKVTDLDGKTIEYSGAENHEFEKLFIDSFYWFQNVSFLDRENTPSDYRQFYHYYSTCRIKGIQWYYVPAFRLGFGYSIKTKLPIWTVTPDGFIPAAQAPRSWFPEDTACPISAGDHSIWRVGDQIEWVDFANTRIKQITQVSPPDRILKIEGFNSEPNSSIMFCAIITNKEVSFYSFGNGYLTTIPILKELSTYGEIEAYFNPKTSTAYVRQSLSDRAGDERPDYLQQVGLSNPLTKTYSLPYIKPVPHLFRSADWMSPIMPLFGWPLYVGSIWLETQFNDPGAERELRDALLWHADFHGWCVRWSYLAGNVFAAICSLFLSSQYRLPKETRRKWGFAILWLGIPGLLTFWVVRDWPSRIACSQCGNQRGVSSPHCDYCNEPSPKPQSDGTEIMEKSEARH